MPELPDVEGFRRALAEQLPGRRVEHVHVDDPGVLNGTTATGLGRSLAGRRFTTPCRHGKWLILPTERSVLLVHSGMTGRPYYLPDPGGPDAAEPDRYDRVVITLDRGELHYADLRKLRGIWLAHDHDAATGMLDGEGPDALAIDRSGFADALRGRRGRLKTTLIDQSVLAGLGNLLADEICWQARIRPERSTRHLDDADLRHLHTTMRRVLRISVRHGRVPGLRRWLTKVRDEPEPACPRCHTGLRRTRTGGRATVWCPNCQPR